MSIKLNIARKGIFAIALGLACALPVAAQNTTGPNTTTTTPNTASTRDDTAVQRVDAHRDWGWLGLLGLAGLLGLRRNRDTHSTDRTRGAAAR
jgi:MYXO-CTERM domain-containing protein